MSDNENMIGCKWMKEAHNESLSYAESSKLMAKHPGSCPPQHDDERAECPHSTDPAGVCTCDLDDNLGWVLEWPKRSKRYPAGERFDTKWGAGREWTDTEDNYTIEQTDGTDKFRVICTDGTLVGEVASLEDAKALAQREYAGIMIIFHGSKAEYDKEHTK